MKAVALARAADVRTEATLARAVSYVSFISEVSTEKSLVAGGCWMKLGA